jgi:hypothetical protein
MGRSQQSGAFSHCGYSLQLHHTTAIFYVRHDDVDGTRLDIGIEAINSMYILPARCWHSGSAVDRREILDWTGRGHLLQPVQIQRFKPSGKIKTILQIEVAVCIDKYIAAFAYGLAYGLNAGNAQVRILFKLGAIGGALWHTIERRQLYRIEPGCDGAGR